MSQLVPLLFLVFSLFLTTLHGQISACSDILNPGFCCNPQPGSKVLSPPFNQLQLIYQSPYYVQVATLIISSKTFDNACYTYFPIVGNSTFLECVGFTYYDGTYSFSIRTVSGLPGYCGVNRVQGISQETGFVYDNVYLGSACQGLSIFYIHYLAASCDLIDSLTKSKVDVVEAHSTIRDVCHYCKSQVAAVANSQLSCTNLTVLPNTLNRRCVTQLYGMRCINANRVLPQDSVTVPETGHVCPGVYTY